MLLSRAKRASRSHMEANSAQEVLARAEALQARSAASSRWLVWYYLVFGVGSLLASIGVGAFSAGVGLAVVMICWMILIAAISIYANTRMAVMRGMGRLHSVVMIAWTIVWVAMVMLGARAGLGLGWWIGGGVVLLVISWLGALVAHRRTGSRRPR